MSNHIITSAEVAEKLKQTMENIKNTEITDVTEVNVEHSEEVKPRPVYSQAYKMMNEEGKKLSRRFLGNIFGRGTEKKEFEAYVKGQATYSFKKQTNLVVRQEFFYV